MRLCFHVLKYILQVSKMCWRINLSLNSTGSDMRIVDMSTVILVHSGETWPHKQPPCNRQMLQFLERNEGLVTWVQPVGGTVEDQYPVIRIEDKYFTMSLRLMKAVW